ncbi:Flagellar export chaperone FliS [Candidatus Bealeia paramacronuclearis]|uniref:Flagellar export chaperone FliS n=1 Tax=Candidatus Bealeia paramacronuclearis TaxID=1921001 RepID=A0ABZ2C4F4_9PROT|nr:Flagellar export chaperone FliS [Candidatus Bealeia paramacronuclearis]
MSYATKLYQKNSTNHAQAIDLVIDIYDEAVNALEEALQAINDNRIQDRFMATEKARKYLIGLSSSLNKNNEETQTLSKTLENYYVVINDLLTRINVYNKPETCLAAIQSLKEMAECWREVKSTAQEEVSPQI